MEEVNKEFNLLTPKDLKSVKLKVIKSNGGCKYHPEIGQEISLEKSLPEGMCPYAYIAAYPYALSLLYDAEFSWRKKVDKDSVVAQCFRSRNQMVFKVKRVSNPDLDKELLKKYEEERYKIYIELIEKKNGGKDCSDCLSYKNMVVGKQFEFNRGDLSEICPAVFNQIAPYLRELASLSKGNQSIQVACPDPKTDVIFEINKL